MKFPVSAAISLLISFASLAVIAGASDPAAAQPRSENAVGESPAPGRSTLPDELGRGLSLNIRFKKLDGLSGGQFRIHYDPEKLAVKDVSSCLSGLPETHAGSFSACNHISERSFIQVIILDLGKNRPIGSGSIGSIEFVKVPGSGQIDGNDISLADVKLAGPDGDYLEAAVPMSQGVVTDVVRR